MGERVKPAGACILCKHPTYSFNLIDKQCSQRRDRKKCRGIYKMVRDADWIKCGNCEGTRMVEREKCISCDGTGWTCKTRCF
jgi:hypothetical protein